MLTVVGQHVEKMELGTAVIPTYPRHPMVLAGQTLTVQSTIRAKLTLGIGLSHKAMMAMLGLEDDKPIAHLRDYLSVLMPLLTTGRVAYDGPTISCHAEVFKPAANPPQVLVAALGPQALKVAGALADGTSLAWVGPKTIRTHIVPELNDAAGKADRATTRHEYSRRCRSASLMTRRASASGSPRPRRCTRPFPRTGRCSTARA